MYLLAKVARGEAKAKSVQALRAEVEVLTGLSVPFANKEELLKTLERKTSVLKNEANIVLIYLRASTAKKFEKLSQNKKNFYQFRRTLSLSRDKELALSAIAFNLLGRDCLYDKEVSKLSQMKAPSFALAPYFRSHRTLFAKDYTVSRLKKDLQEKRYAYIVDLPDVEAQELLELIEQNPQTIFALSSERLYEKRRSIATQFINGTSFLSFYIPDNFRPQMFDPSKIAGQEDIMTTLYHLSLSERAYLSLGDDLFTDSNSDAIGEELIADQNGAWIKSKFYPWRNERFDSSGSEYLKNRAMSTRSICRFLLQESIL